MSRKTLLTMLILYLVSSVVSYGAIRLMSPASQTVTTGTDQTGVSGEDESTLLTSLLQIDPATPKDQPCPLNGKMFTAAEKEAWEKRRPLAVMIENTPDARPQSGMGSADIVFEAVAEGGVTRFMGMFYCGVQAYDTTLAPIRSARTYYVMLASGFNLPMYVHVGGANIPGPTDALGQIGEYGWNGQNDMNQFSIGYPTFVRDYNRVPGKEIATEHTMVTTTEKLWQVATKRGWTNLSPSRKVGRTTVGGDDWKDGYTGWTFGDGKPAASPTASTISYEFWTGFQDYAVEWNYDAQTNTYKRKHGGEAHTDLNNNQPVAASDVVVMFTAEKGPLNEKKHMMYEVVGTGDALIFKDGQVINATWSKKDREAELQFSEKGKPVEFTRGMVWVSILAKGSEVKY
jgi:hypothetical protein